MRTRSSGWVVAPTLKHVRHVAVLSSLAGVLAFAYSLTSSAQVPAAKADAGAPTSAPTVVDAGSSSATARTGEAGAPSVTSASTSDAGTTPTTQTAPAGTGDASASTRSSVPTFRRPAPALPPPTPQQLSAYEALRAEADVFERGARDYRETLTNIITLHYEEKKKLLLSGLDREIGIEQAELKKARDTAIARLEEFIAKYSGSNAQPEATPDAMYRLAALYEERARTVDSTEDLGIRLKPAIALYKRVINEFPKYRELAGIYYFLGHALNDSSRTAEAQQVWRSLVCANHYKYPTPPDAKDATVDTVLPLPQDNTHDYWVNWRRRYFRPEQLRKGGADSKFIDPYPQDCQTVPQPGLRPGDQPRYVAEVWWQIGNWEFDQLDLGGGVVEFEPYAVWDFNRSASAYQHSMQFDKPPLYGVSLYKYAWTLFKQQRYEAATKEFVLLLNYTDEQQKLTGDPGADFRSEAYTYIAGSLTNIDFTGPGPEEPFIQREDILTTEMRPGVAEQKLRVAIDRVQDPKLVPQDKPWTLEIYRALAMEYRAMNHYMSAIAVYEKMLQKWPMDPTAPDMQNGIAETYELLARSTKVGEERQKYEAEVLKARTALAKYVGDTPWVDANKENPAALQRAEELVRTGLKSAAITHTKNGQAAIDEIENTSDRGRQLFLLTQALTEYRLAALGWQGYLKQDENAPDAYKSRYFYADALHQQVRIQVLVHGLNSAQYPEPTAQEIDTAKRASMDVRDSDEDDQFLDNAAFFVVDLSDVDRDLAYQKAAETKGTQGVPQRDEPRLEGPDGDKKVVADPIPGVVQSSMLARDEYVMRVPPVLDKTNRMPSYQFYSAQQYFVYGHFKDARDRFEVIYKERCGKDELGYEAWKRLIVMSNLQKDAERSRQLAEAEKANSCAKTDVQKGDARMLVDPTIQNAAYLDARKKFQQAQAMKPGPERDKVWREAAGMYEAALKAAPGHDDAPEAAMNAAYAYKQVGDFNKAIELYNLFIDKYGSEENLTRLQKGDPKTKAAPDPKKYGDRINYLGQAYDALSSTYYGFFNYQRAAESYAKIANNDRFDDTRRQNAARISMILYSNVGDRANMNAEYTVLTKLRPSADRRAEADFLRANYEYNLWNPQGGDTGRNAELRRNAIGAFMTFYNANRNTQAGARYAEEAAYKIAKMMRSVGDGAYRTWFKNTIAAWQFFQKNPSEQTGPNGEKTSIRAESPPYNDYAAEADFTLIDEEIHNDFDYETGHHKFTGNVVEVKKKYDDAYETADKKYKPRLDTMAKTYQSFEWTPAIMARTGTLYDSLRTGLDLVVPKYFTPQQEALLNRLESLGQQEKADEIRDQVRTAWRQAKDERLDVANQNMITRYVQAALFARKYNVRNTAVQHAVARLAFFTDYLGDEKMKKYVDQVVDPLDPNKGKVAYSSNMFLQWRAGIDGHPVPNGHPAPLPVAP